MPDMPTTHLPHPGHGANAKIGGKPIYLWAAVVGGAILVYVWWSRKNANAAAAAANTDPTATLTDPTLTSGGLGSNDGLSSGGGASYPGSGYDPTAGSGSTTDPNAGSSSTDPNATDPNATDPNATDPNAPTGPQDNVSWESAAVAYLSKHGVSAEYAQQAVELYLNGYKTSYQQHLWLNKVLANVGLPPEGAAAIPTWGAKPKPKPKHPAHHTTHSSHHGKHHPAHHGKRRRRITIKRRGR